MIVLGVLEAGIRLAAPQHIEDIPYEDVFTIRFSPALGQTVKALVPGITRSYSGTTVHINSLGNRDYEYSKVRKPSVYRIAIVGSSVSYGFRLELEDTFAKRLERELNGSSGKKKYEVLLFGCPGFLVKEVYADVMDEVLSYDPDVIIYSFVQNSYVDAAPEQVICGAHKMRSWDNKIRGRSSLSLLSVMRNRFVEIKHDRLVQMIRRNSHLYLYMVNSIARLLRELSPQEKMKAEAVEPLYPDVPRFQTQVVNTEKWIDLIAKECKGKGITFAVMLLPYEMQLNREGIDKWRARGIAVPDDAIQIKTRDYMETFCSREAIYCIDVVPAFRKYAASGGNLFLDGDYAHLSGNGHSIVAGVLKSFVEKLTTRKNS